MSDADEQFNETVPVEPERTSEQRYTHPRSLNWMALGLCPECGYAPEEHSMDARFWIPRGCSLREDGVRNRLAQFKRDVGVDAPAQAGTMPGVSCPVCHAAAGQPCEKRDEIDRVPHLARLQKTLQKGEAMPTRAQLAAAALREKRGLPPIEPVVVEPDPPPDVLRCPVHSIPDCSLLLNGCSIPNRLAAVWRDGYRRGRRI